MDMRDKTIKGLQQCLLDSGAVNYDTQCFDCPYFEHDISVNQCRGDLLHDALALLKAPEPVRCKDCAHFVANNAEEGDWSGRCANMNGTTVDGWWFCADAERG